MVEIGGKQVALKRNNLEVFGGFAAQLLGLSYAIFLSRNRRTHPRLLFNSGGLTPRPLSIRPILETPTIRNLNIEYAELFYPKHHHHVPRGLKKTIRLSERLLYGLNNPGAEEHICTIDDLLRMPPKTRNFHGYFSDFRVVETVLEILSIAISESTLPNFLETPDLSDGIAIHWRLGDYVSNQFHGVLSPESISRALDFYEPEWKEKKLTIFTDSPEKMASSRVKDSLGAFSVAGGDIWRDMYEMSRARLFIGSHSSVSQWVALSLVKRGFENRAILPGRWFLSSNPMFDSPQSAMLGKAQRYDFDLIDNF